MPSGFSGRHFCCDIRMFGTQNRDLTLAIAEHSSGPFVDGRQQLHWRIMMKNRFAVSLIAASLFASSAAFAQSTTAAGAVNGARAGGEVAGPVGEIVGGTVGAAVGAGLEIPNAVITSIQGERAPSVRVRERIVVGEPLPEAVELRPVPRHTEYRYAVVNDRRVIVEPRTRRIIKIIE
jgi:Protein of unknown function (DUF1236)